MKKRTSARRWGPASALCALVVISPITSAQAQSIPPASAGQSWRDTARSPQQRADALLSAMTLDEKVTLVLATDDKDFDPLTHLGIPRMRRVDASGGLRGDTGVTAFPAPNALGATFDPDLAERYGQAVGAEARAKGWNVVLGPTVDVDRNGLSGRAAESYGEDPLVNGEMGAAVAGGVESNGVIAMLKHFTVYNQESGPRETLSVGLSERALREVHYPAFERAIRKGGADSVMCAYPRINGTYACQNEELLTDLKQDLGLKGYVATDFSPRTDPVAGINAGVDSQSLFAGMPREAFFDGRIPEQRTNDAARRILIALFDSGAFDKSLPEKIPAVVTTPAHQRLARETGAAGSVLLKNDAVLPLRKQDSVAVIGPAGRDAVTGVEGSSYVNPGDFTTLVEAVQGKAGKKRTMKSQGSLGDVALPTVPTSVLNDPEGQNGLRAEFFANESFQGAPVTTVTTPQVDFTGAPVEGLPAKWSARFTGTITPTATGLARISSLLSGSAKVVVDGETVFDGSRFAWDFFFAPQEYTLGGTVRLTEGRPVPITIEYSTRNAGYFGHRLTLGWQPQSLIPAAVKAAKQADAAVVVVNEFTGEAVDRVGLRLPGDQEALIEAVAAVNRNTVVVLNTPGPMLMPWLDKVEGVVQAWYQGAAVGTATADVLYGDADPGGRLPVTFPAAAGQGPKHDTSAEVRYDEGIYVGYKWYDREKVKPLFPFGYGLSYTSFDYRNLRVRQEKAGAATVTVQVRNTGRRQGSDTVQVYVGHLPDKSVDTPAKKLAGFAKVTLRPGGRQDVRIEVDRQALSYWDEDADRWVTPTGRVPVYVGRSSADVRLEGSITIK